MGEREAMSRINAYIIERDGKTVLCVNDPDQADGGRSSFHTFELNPHALGRLWLESGERFMRLANISLSKAADDDSFDP